MPQYVYLAEADGPRVIRYGGANFTYVNGATTSTVLLDVGTWDIVPTGPAGDNVFRMVVVTVRYTNGYSIRVTPTVDGTALPAQDFAQTGGAGIVDCQAWVVKRGARLSVRVQQMSSKGTLELVDIQWAGVPMRKVP